MLNRIFIFLICSLSVIASTESKNIYDSIESIEINNNKTVILCFFSSGCSACYNTLLDLRLHLYDNPEAFELIGITTDLREDIENFIKRFSFTYPIINDYKLVLHKKFKAINFQGVIVLPKNKKQNPIKIHLQQNIMVPILKCLKK